MLKYFLLFFSGFGAVMLVAFIGYLIQASIYKKSTYYNSTKNVLIKVLLNKGLFGEYKTFKYLERYENDGAKILFNCYLPANEGRTSEVDLIMISKEGIYVIESKNYSGWIFGDEKSKMWMQSLKGEHGVQKNKFYNPIMQNRTHIKWLRELINSKLGYDITPVSLVVFSERCSLKKIKNSDPLVKVINRYNLLNEIEKFKKTFSSSIDDQRIQELYALLKPYTEVSAEDKQKHIDDINEFKK